MTIEEKGSEFISHYGVKGMRWGVRKERTVVTTSRPDQGLLRRQTKIKVKGGEAHNATEDAVKAAVQQQKLKRSGAAALSNHELRELSTRLRLEEEVNALTSKKGKRFVRRQIAEGARSEAQQRIRKGTSEAIKIAL